MLSCYRSKCKQRLSSHQRGGVLLEAAFGGSSLFIIMFLICDTSLVFLKAATTQYVLAREARNSLAYNQIKGMSALQIKERIKLRAENLGITTLNWDITVCRAAVPNCTSSTLGNGTDLLILKVNPKLKIFGGTVPINYIASILISREPTA